MPDVTIKVIKGWVVQQALSTRIVRDRRGMAKYSAFPVTFFELILDALG